jgi:formate hydrogenlyase subunit 6/NADH:ubiquinone oxidoreductase subunit I
MPVTRNEKKLIQIGVVALNKELCVVHVKKKHCGACGEACPTNAIFPVEKGRVLFPDINNSYCIGCGGCEQACPTSPKSIKVTANRVHLKAEVYVPPELPVLDIDVKSDFPF